MTAFSMILSFIMLIVGGYGFSSTKVASLNIPLMQKIAPTVHSWAFLNPLFCGLVLFAYSVMSVSNSLRIRALQATLAILTLLFLFDAPALYVCVTGFSSSMRPSLESLLLAESGIGALIFIIPGAFKLRAWMREEQAVIIVQ